LTVHREKEFDIISQFLWNYRKNYYYYYYYYYYYVNKKPFAKRFL